MFYSHMIIYLFCSSCSVCIFSSHVQLMENVSFSSGGPDWLKKFSNRTFLYACFINLSMYIFILLLTFPQVLYLLNDSLLYLWPLFILLLSSTLHLWFPFPILLSRLPLPVCLAMLPKPKVHLNLKLQGRMLFFIFLMQSREDGEVQGSVECH